MGKPNTFLSIQIKYNKGYSLLLHQTKYMLNLLTRFEKDIPNTIQYSTPFESNLKLEKSNTQANSKEIKEFQQQVGSLLYFAIKTRLDIVYAVNQCSKYISNLGKSYQRAFNRI